jgi:hypothetical protein
MHERSGEANGLAPTASLVLVSVLAQALVVAAPRRRRERIISAAMEAMERYADLAEVPRIRPSPRDAELAEAIAQANAWLRALLPMLRAAARG